MRLAASVAKGFSLSVLLKAVKKNREFTEPDTEFTFTLSCFVHRS